MQYPRVESVSAVDGNTLLVAFDNQQQRLYDITPLLSKEMFSPLRNQAFFKSVRVDAGGFAIVWDENIDISEYELWKNSQPIP
jgi:hypothetical protein